MAAMRGRRRRISFCRPSGPGAFRNFRFRSVCSTFDARMIELSELFAMFFPMVAPCRYASGDGSRPLLGLIFHCKKAYFANCCANLQALSDYNQLLLKLKTNLTENEQLTLYSRRQHSALLRAKASISSMNPVQVSSPALLPATVQRILFKPIAQEDTAETVSMVASPSTPHSAPTSSRDP